MLYTVIQGGVAIKFFNIFKDHNFALRSMGSIATDAHLNLLFHGLIQHAVAGCVLAQVNCVLEAFGHAKTPMNANSSRFIKLLTVHYCERRRTILRGTVTHKPTTRYGTDDFTVYNFRKCWIIAEQCFSESSIIYSNASFCPHHHKMLPYKSK